MVNEIDWHAVLNAYLVAVREDEIRCRREVLCRVESEVLSRFSGESLRQRHARRLQRELDAVIQSQPTPLIVIKESPEEVLVQMNAKGKGSEMPPITTRFLLERRNSGWLVQGLFRPCPYCDSSELIRTGKLSSREIGRCPSCHGSGKGYSFSWLSVLSRSKPVLNRPPCQLCNGTGKCSCCSKEPYPGWQSVDSVSLKM
jgi:hypothetical protein